MFSEPDDSGVVRRMREAHGVACGVLGAAIGSSDPVGEAWGWRGRTLGRAVIGAHGAGWLRVVHSPVGKASGKLWAGPEDAERAVPLEVPRPRLRAVREWAEGEDAFRAELYEYVGGHVLTAGDVSGLTASWWIQLRTALERLSGVPTERVAVRQAYMDRAMPKYLGFLDAPVPTTPPAWTTAHGDLHWANLTGPDLRILDWEGWGIAPAGYDAAMLHAYSLAVPESAERVRRELSGFLGCAAGRLAELVVITELLQSAERGDNLELVPALRARAREVRGRMDGR
ncbi:phosphotransferase [Streptomyces sp. SID4985]|nr:phosphotransferase [Streptomyces sp. SID4985]